MICPQCQHENPDANRFCGNCGAALQIEPAAERVETVPTNTNEAGATESASQALGSHYEPEGFDEEDAPKLSHEVIEYDKQIPLIAEPGSDRRHHVPKHIMDEVHDFLDDLHAPAPQPSQNGATAYEDQLRTERSARANARVESDLNPKSQGAPHSGYLDIEDARDSREPQSDRVSGPSFLGLGNSDYEYVYDDQRPSHWRRNFALLILIVLAVLAAVQWRSIRDMGLEYAKSGTIKIKVPKHGEQAQPNANANQANTPNNNGNGAPNLSVDPTRNADAENAKLKAEEEAAKGEQSGNQQNSPTGTNNPQPNTATATPPAIPPADTATTDNVDNTRSATNNSANTSSNAARTNTQPATRGGSNPPSTMSAPAGSASNAAATEEATPPPSRSVAQPSAKKTSAQASRATPSVALPGAFEMQQANILGQTPQAVPWLWSALGKGNPDAPVKLADMYLTGHGVEKSCDQGLVILRSAAARGNARASARLGTLYATGICVQQNRVQAYEWMGTAAGRSQSLSSWADAYRQNLLQQMTPEERARVR